MGIKNMAMLELKKINAAYGRIQILHDISLHVEEKEVVCVIGPNGAGKSTTFKVIMGFVPIWLKQDGLRMFLICSP